jgi:hypothetical protein
MRVSLFLNGESEVAIVYASLLKLKEKLCVVETSRARASQNLLTKRL